MRTAHAAHTVRTSCTAHTAHATRTSCTAHAAHTVCTSCTAHNACTAHASRMALLILSTCFAPLISHVLQTPHPMQCLYRLYRAGWHVHHPLR
eukprot:73703-Chlamydomonas_euryale.AAC.1